MKDDSLTASANDTTQNLGRHVAVIGAGISGLACARILRDRGYQITVFDKSRGVGGRMSTRRAGNSLQFDHGAQYFTVRDPRFNDHVRSWLRDGVVARWPGRIVTLEAGAVKEEKADTERFVATPRMSAICKSLAIGINLRLETEVAPPRRIGNQWQLAGGGEDLGRFDTVIVSAPPAQASRLLVAAPELAGQAESTEMQGCWALMLALSQPSELEFSGAFVHGSPISWIARDSDKPGRASMAETWVVHASGDWTAQHLELASEQVAPLLIDAFWQATGLPPQSLQFSSVHRWRYALPPKPLDVSYLFDNQLQIGACGDWCGGPRVEGAFLSGVAIAERILANG